MAKIIKNRTKVLQFIPDGWKLKIRGRLNIINRSNVSPGMWKVKQIVKQEIENPRQVPRAVLIETNSRCNASCTMCPQPDLGRPHQTMSKELYEKIILECVENEVGLVQLNGTNEPLLDPLLMERIYFAKSKGIKELYCYTNGSLLKGKIVQKLLDSPLDLLVISFDALCKEFYPLMRNGLDFETVKNNTLHILRERERQGKKLAIVIASSLYDEKNVEIALNSELYKELKQLSDGVEIMLPHELHDWAGQFDISQINNNKTSQKVSVPCQRLWSRMSIHPDGKIALCCLDYKGIYSSGSVAEKTITEIWNGQTLADIRKAHLTGKIELCRNCSEADPLRWLNPHSENILKKYAKE